MLCTTMKRLTPACVMLLSAAFAYGQACDDEGVVRLGRRHRRQANQAPCDAASAAYGGATFEQAPCGAACPPGTICPEGVCPGGVCGYGPCGHGPGCACHEHLCQVLQWLSPYHTGCTLPPDHGWAPPLKKPMNGAATGEPGSIGRVPVRYTRYFPAAWTGEQTGARAGFRYPMVYMPTDTTQLGYYYQQVPTWSPNPGMVPPVPNPAEWHSPDFSGSIPGCGICRHAGSGAYCPEGCPAGWECPSEGVVSGEDSYEPGYPVENSYGPTYEFAPVIDAPVGQPAEPYAPIPSDDSALEAALEKSAGAPELVPVPRR